MLFLSKNRNGFTLIVIAFVLQGCFTFTKTPRQLKKYFAEKQVPFQRVLSNFGHRKLHYVKTGDAKKTTIVFVHGSPGSYSAFLDFLSDSTLRQHFQLVSVDRPGFGYANYGWAEPSIDLQADIITEIIQSFSGKVILVGHSLGGPVIANLAMRYPQHVRGIILVAASVDPKLEPNERWFRGPLRTPFLKWILPVSMRVSNEEIYDLRTELEYMLPQWKNIVCPVAIVHGERDQLVPYQNVDFIQQQLNEAVPKFLFTKKEMNHFVPWTNPELIHQAIFKMEEVTKPTN